MNLKVLKKNKLDDYTIYQILKLKETYWRKGLSSQKIWFKNNIHKNDLHLVLFHKKNLIGYLSLRERKIFFTKNEKKIKKFLYFDTLIIRKDFRGFGLAKKIVDKSQKISKEKKLPMFLICKNKTIVFYKKQGWMLINKKKIKFIDHLFTTNAMVYCSINFYKKKIMNKKIFLEINRK